MTNWLILFILIAFPIIIAITGKKAAQKEPDSRIVFYLKSIAGETILLCLLFLLQPNAFTALDFTVIEKGFTVEASIWTAVLPVFFVPFFLALSPWNSYPTKDIATARELFGYPAAYLPSTWKQYGVFGCYLILGVLFEEVFCRQLMFYSFHSTLGLKGDVLLVVSSVLFAVGHLYQGWKGMAVNLLYGFLFGKVFQLSGSIAYPIVLHLFLNATILPLAYRRIKELSRQQTQTAMQTPS